MIKIIRGIGNICFFAVFALGSLFFGFILFPLIKIFIKDEQKRLDCFSNIIYKTWKQFVGYLERIKILKINLKTSDEIKSLKNCIIVSTHPSYIDVLILLSIIPKTTCFVAPKLGRNIFFKNIVNSLFLISGEPIEKLEKNASKMLKYGFNILIFPMGTRHRQNEFPKIHKGAAFIALKSKKDIVPIKMHTNFDFLFTHQPILDGGNKTVIYDIEFQKRININDFIQYTDEIIAKKNITEKIEEKLYNSNKT